MDYKITKKQIPVLDMYKMAWGMFKNNIQTIGLIILIVYVPVNLLLELVWMNASDLNFQTQLDVIEITEGLFGVLASMALMLCTKKWVEGKEIDYKEALLGSFKKWHIVILTSILMGLYMIGLVLALIIPALIFSMYWAFYVQAIILNNKTGNEALKYSKSLVYGRWWDVFGQGLLIGLASIPIYIVAAIVSGIAYVAGSQTIMSGILSGLVIDFTYGFMVIVGAIFYLNLEKSRTELPDKKKNKNG